MSQSNVSGWLPGLLGPLELQVDGTPCSAPKRTTVNLVGAEVEDDPVNERTNITFAGGGGGGTPGGSSGDVQVNDAGGFAGVSPGTSGNLLKSNGSAWSSAAPAFSTAVLTSGTLAEARGGTGFTAFGTGVAAWLQDPTSAKLKTAVTDETGSGALVFANTPTLVTPVLGAATGVSAALSSFVSFTGSGTVPTTGRIRFPNTGSDSPVITKRNFEDDADRAMLSTWNNSTILGNVDDGTEVRGQEVLISASGVLGLDVTAGAVFSVLSHRFNDDVWFRDSGADHYYKIVVSDLAADRNITLPLLGASDQFTFDAHATTLTNKTISLASNTLTGTSAQFKTACSDETGSGALVFADTPTLVTPVIGAATGTSLAATSFLSVGSVPSTTGDQRFPNPASVRARDVGNTNDRVIWSTNAANEFFIGTNDAFSTTQWGTLRIAAGNPITIGTSVNQNLVLEAASLKTLYPIIGHGSPYSVHGSVVSAMTDADYTVPAGEYSYSQIVVPNGVRTAARKFLLPTPATEAASYSITVTNDDLADALNVYRADGTNATVSIGPSTSKVIRMRPGGAYSETF